jgi:hypothetical protein
MNQTVAQLIEALQKIEDQNQPIVSVIVIAEDLFSEDDDYNDNMTVTEFQGHLAKNEGRIIRAIDDAYEGIRDAIY